MIMVRLMLMLMTMALESSTGITQSVDITPAKVATGNR